MKIYNTCDHLFIFNIFVSSWSHVISDYTDNSIPHCDCMCYFNILFLCMFIDQFSRVKEIICLTSIKRWWGNTELWLSLLSWELKKASLYHGEKFEGLIPSKKGRQKGLSWGLSWKQSIMYFTTSLLHNSHDFVFTIRVIRKISNKKINIKSFWSVFQVTGKSNRERKKYFPANLYKNPT